MGYLSPTERQNLSGQYDNVFDTWKRDIIIHKSPQKVPIPQAPDAVFGFGESQSSDAYSYTPVTGVYPARIKYADEDFVFLREVNSYIPIHPITIRVQSDAKDFIDNGVTEKIIVDGRSYVMAGESIKNNFLTLEYYTYRLRALK